MTERRGSRRVLVATNKHLRALPEWLQDDALCEVAREMARQIDAGQVSAAGQLTRVLNELRKLAAPAKSTAAEKSAAPAEAVEEEPAPDELDEVARMRVDRLAGASGVVRAIRGDQRRAGGAVPG